MLLAAALDRIAELPRRVPKVRLEKFILRLRSGLDVDTSLALETLASADLAALDVIRGVESLSRDPKLLAELLDQAYRRTDLLPVDPEVVWTGPSVDPTIPYIRTSSAARRIVDRAHRVITIAGYHVTSEALERIHVWRALERGVAVTVLVDGSDLKPVDRHVFLSKGIQLRTVSAVAKGFAKFHVKAIISDDERALVGSANFTTLGHSDNIEIGVALEGPAAATIGAMLRSYVAFAESAGWVISK